MNRRSPFGFDISVSADKRRRAKNRSSSGAFERSSRTCEAKGCDSMGKYRAPRSPKNMDEFHWFCLKHVKEYNQKWNFFEDHSAEELEKQFRADRVWERKTTPFSDGSDQNEFQPEGRAWARLGLDDPYEILSSSPEAVGLRKKKKEKRLPASERKALEVLGAADTMSKSDMRKIYKELVKDLHPDRNSGSRADEERLSEVVWAWDQLKASRSFKE
jgi:hypothetical protein